MTDRVAERPDTELDGVTVDPGAVWGMYLVIALSMTGTLLVALAYAGGRTQVGWATWLYWPGQLLAFVPVAYRVSSRYLSSAREGLVLVLVLCLNQIMIKWMYSPLMLKFHDELQHWRGTQNLVDAGTWNTPNLALPVARNYPALELVGGAIASSTGLSAMTSAFLVAGLLRLLQVLALYALFERLSSNARVAAVASVIYVANPHYLFFDGMYIYQTMALPFLIVAVWVVRRWHRGAQGAVTWVLMVLAAAMTTVSHHVTSFVLVIALVVLALTDLGRGRRRVAWRPAAGAALTAAMVASWVLLVARDVPGYFVPVYDELASAVQGLLTLDLGSSEPSSAPIAGSPTDRAFTLASLALLGWLVVSGGRQLWRTRHHDRWSVPLILGAAMLFGMVGLRVVVANGAELSGRASTFVYIPVAFVAAQRALDWQRRQVRTRARRWPPALVRLARVGVASVVLVGGIASGWPPPWGRIPGPFRPGGFELSVEPQGLMAANWARDTLGPGHRWAADFDGYVLLSTIGDQDVVRDVSVLYRGAGVTPVTQQLVRNQQIELLAVDLRTCRQLPASGAYFPMDPQANQYTSPLGCDDLAVFDTVDRVSRLYDSGDVRLYDLRDSAYVY